LSSGWVLTFKYEVEYATLENLAMRATFLHGSPVIAQAEVKNDKITGTDIVRI
jgi:hypothetical protein